MDEIILTWEAFEKLPFEDARPRFGGQPFVCPRVLGIDAEGLMPDPRSDQEIRQELFLSLLRNAEG